MFNSWGLSLDGGGGSREEGDPQFGLRGSHTSFLVKMAAKRGTGGSLAGSGIHLILAQSELVLSRGWLTHENSTALVSVC